MPLSEKQEVRLVAIDENTSPAVWSWLTFDNNLRTVLDRFVVGSKGCCLRFFASKAILWKSWVSKELQLVTISSKDAVPDKGTDPT